MKRSQVRRKRRIGRRRRSERMAREVSGDGQRKRSRREEL